MSAGLDQISRREALKLGAATATMSLLGACSSPAVKQSLVAYCSVDADIARPIFDRFTQQTGIGVDAVYDTEATKTTGLVNRLLGEASRPRADVWWSSEAFGSIRLARAGVLEKFTSVRERDFPRGWPRPLRASDATWYGHARRMRVLVYHTQFVKAGDVPKSLGALAAERWRGRVGVARPQFGTTRGHVAALASEQGVDALERWLKAMKDNRVRVYDGNAGVVRAVGTGDVLVGLTDNDDVASGKANAWSIEQAFVDDAMAAGPRENGLVPDPMQLPCTVARVKGGPGGALGARLADFLLSAEVDDALTTSGFQTYPIREPTRGTDGLVPRDANGREWLAISNLNLERVADFDERAQSVCAKVWG